jgi:hypothetical protein
MDRSTPPRYQGAWSGYLWSVTGATVPVFILMAALSLVSFWRSAEVWHLAQPFVSGAIFWIFAFVAGLIPFATSVAIGIRFTIRSGWFYALCGILTGLLLAKLWMVSSDIARYFDASPPPEPGENVAVAGVFVMAGFAGAMTYWWKRGRFLGTEGPH